MGCDYDYADEDDGDSFQFHASILRRVALLLRLTSDSTKSITSRLKGFAAALKQILHAEQDVEVGSPSEWSNGAYDRKLHAALDDEPRTCGVLKSRRKVILSCFAAGHGRGIETTRATMNKRGFQNQKQLTARLLIVARQQNVFEIRVQSLFVSHA